MTLTVPVLNIHFLLRTAAGIDSFRTTYTQNGHRGQNRVLYKS